MPEKSEFDKALGELHDLTEWEDAEAAIRELHARGPEIERLSRQQDSPRRAASPRYGE